MRTSWSTFKIHCRRRHTVHDATIGRLTPESPATKLLSLDGRGLPGKTIPLRGDRREHTIEMEDRVE
ncbi:MAG: hypothetical protein WAO20_04620 [Acidobacteriota bacterium]